MKIVKMAGFACWMYYRLTHLRHFRREIRKYRALGDYEKEREQILNSTSDWGRQLMERYRIKLNVSGLENLPEGPVLFVSNHQGYADIPVFCAVLAGKKQAGFVAKRSLGRIPIYGGWIQDIRSVFIDRDDARSSLKTMEEGIDLLKKGFSLVIFPEGTRSRGPKLGEFKKGSLRLATKSGVPVVPVTLNGTYRIFEDHGYVKPGAEVDFHIHPAIETEGLSKAEQNGLAERVRSIILSKLEEFQQKEQAS